MLLSKRDSLENSSTTLTKQSCWHNRNIA